MGLAASPRNFMNFLLTLSLGALCVGAENSQARNLVGHKGLGVTNVGPGFGSPQISAVWQMTQGSAIEAEFGIDTLQTANSLSLGLRYQKHLFLEESLYYSVYLGGGLLNAPSGATSSSGFYVESGGLATFFLANQPNLALQVGSGVRMETPASSRIRTVFFGGFHYYF
jgi:hypothetical protein